MDAGYDRKVIGHLNTYAKLREINGTKGLFWGRHPKTLEVMQVSITDRGFAHPQRFEIHASIQRDPYFAYKREGLTLLDEINGEGPTLDEVMRRIEWKKL